MTALSSTPDAPADPDVILATVGDRRIVARVDPDTTPDDSPLRRHLNAALNPTDQD